MFVFQGAAYATSQVKENAQAKLLEFFKSIGGTSQSLADFERALGGIMGVDRISLAKGWSQKDEQSCQKLAKMLQTDSGFKKVLKQAVKGWGLPGSGGRTAKKLENASLLLAYAFVSGSQGSTGEFDVTVRKFGKGLDDLQVSICSGTCMLLELGKLMKIGAAGRFGELAEKVQEFNGLSFEAKKGYILENLGAAAWAATQSLAGKVRDAIISYYASIEKTQKSDFFDPTWRQGYAQKPQDPAEANEQAKEKGKDWFS